MSRNGMLSHGEILALPYVYKIREASKMLPKTDLNQLFLLVIRAAYLLGLFGPDQTPTASKSKKLQ